MQGRSLGMPSYRPRELRRRPVAQSTMRTDAIVVLPPRFCHGPCLVDSMFIPMQILHLFGLSAGDEVWVRVVGMLASIIGFHYLQAARAGLEQFIP
jgi:hypothetical protein